MAVKNSKNSSGFVLFCFFFLHISKLRGTICQEIRYRVPILSKMVYKRVRGWTSERRLPVKIFMCTCGPK